MVGVVCLQGTHIFAKKMFILYFRISALISIIKQGQVLSLCTCVIGNSWIFYMVIQS